MSQYGGTNVDFTAIIRQMQQQEAQRNEDALARYAQANTLAQQLTQQVGAMGTYGAAEAQMNMVGNAAHQRISEGATQQFAQADQDLMNRGLGNTTIRSSVQRGIGMDEQRAMNELDEGLAAQRSGLLERRAGQEFQSGVNEIDTLLSRVDEPIDYVLWPACFSRLRPRPKASSRSRSALAPATTDLNSGRCLEAEVEEAAGEAGREPLPTRASRLLLMPPGRKAPAASRPSRTARPPSRNSDPTPRLDRPPGRTERAPGRGKA